jgi:hypothetical protein
MAWVPHHVHQAHHIDLTIADRDRALADCIIDFDDEVCSDAQEVH